MNIAKNILFVLLGGGFGSVCRYLIGLGIQKIPALRIGGATIIANLVGCLVIGLLAGLIQKNIVPVSYRPLLITGFLGGLTTFSSFSLEFIQFVQSNNYRAALTYFLINVLAGFSLCLLGLFIAEKI